MVTIRLKRVGTKNRPAYRVIVTDSRSPRDGRFIESLGHYDPLTQPATVKIDEARALHWLKVGAKPSDTVRSLLSKQGLLQKLAQDKRTSARKPALSEVEA